MNDDLQVTHTGWLLFCPVIANLDDENNPHICERWQVLAPLFWLAVGVQQFMNMFHDDERAGFYLRLKEVK
jgi:hypothetical protein